MLIENIQHSFKDFLDIKDIVKQTEKKIYIVKFKHPASSALSEIFMTLAVFEDEQDALDYIKSSPIFSSLSIETIALNPAKNDTILANNGKKIIYNIQKKHIVKIIDGFFPIEEFDIPSLDLTYDKSVYNVSITLDTSHVDHYNDAIALIEAQANSFLEQIGFFVFEDLKIYNIFEPQLIYKTVINYELRTVEIIINNEDMLKCKVVNFATPAGIVKLTQRYSTYLQQNSYSGLKSVLMDIKHEFDTYF